MMMRISVLAAVVALGTYARAEDAAATAARKTMHEAMQDQADMPMHAPMMPGGPATSGTGEHARHMDSGKPGPADAAKHGHGPAQGRVDASHADAANRAAMGAAMGGGPNGGTAGARGPGMMGSSTTPGGMMGGTGGEMNGAMMQQQTGMHPGGMMGGSTGGGMMGGTTGGGGMMGGTTGSSGMTPGTGGTPTVGTMPGGTTGPTGGTAGTGTMTGGGMTGTPSSTPAR